MGLALLAGFQTGATTHESAREIAFSYDPSESPGAKPSTSEDFRNDPYNFQCAILGDRGGGASPLGIYERAIQQLDWCSRSS